MIHMSPTRPNPQGTKHRLTDRDNIALFTLLCAIPRATSLGSSYDAPHVAENDDTQNSRSKNTQTPLSPMHTTATDAATLERKAATPARPELELLAPLLKHKGVAAAERMPAAEPVLLLLVRVGVVAAVEARAQLRVREHLVRLVDGRHLLLGRLLGEPLLGRLVGVVDLGEFAVRRLDLPLVGVVRDPEHLVVVLGRAALEGELGLLEELVGDLALLGRRGGFLGRLEGGDGGVEFFGFELGFRAVEEAVEGGFVKGEGFFAVFIGFFAVGLLGELGLVCLGEGEGGLTS